MSVNILIQSAQGYTLGVGQNVDLNFYLVGDGDVGGCQVQVQLPSFLVLNGYNPASTTGKLTKPDDPDEWRGASPPEMPPKLEGQNGAWFAEWERDGTGFLRFKVASEERDRRGRVVMTVIEERPIDVEAWTPYLERQRPVTMAGWWQQPWQKAISVNYFTCSFLAPFEAYTTPRRGWKMSSDPFLMGTMHCTAVEEGVGTVDSSNVAMDAFRTARTAVFAMDRPNHDVFNEVLTGQMTVTADQPALPVDLNGDDTYTAEDFYLRLQQALMAGEIQSQEVVNDLQFLFEELTG